ncbi:MAG: hypothetical protein ACTSV1_01800 [Alphaproteobacteria bacterium]
MKRLTTSLVLLLSLAVGFGGAMPVSAQGNNMGLLNAVAFKDISKGTPFSVRPLDNSDMNMALKAEFERILRRNGYTVSSDAALVISFETRDQIGAYSTRDKRAVLELQARGGREGGEDAKMRFNLFDSNTGGVFNRGKGETTIATPTQYRIDITVDDAATGKRYWQAWAVADLTQPDSMALTRAMVPVLVENLGQTVKSKTFELF